MTYTKLTELATNSTQFHTASLLLDISPEVGVNIAFLEKELNISGYLKIK